MPLSGVWKPLAIGPGAQKGFLGLACSAATCYERAVRHAISPSIESVVTKYQSWNPLATEWTSRLTTSPINSTTQPSDAGQNESRVEDLIKTLTSALDIGFYVPRAEIITFNRDPLEYCQFIHNFNVNIASLINDPCRRLVYLIQYCQGEAKQVIENCCMYEPKCGSKKAREIFYHQFGRPHIVAQAHVNQLIKGQMMNPTDGSDQMLKCDITLTQTGYDANLNNSEMLLKITDRLPPPPPPSSD